MYNIPVPLLSTIIWTPILGGLLLFALNNKRYEKCLIFLSLVIVSISLGLSIVGLQGFSSDIWQMQYVEHMNWLPSLGIAYALGIDGFSLPLAVLTCFMSVLVIIAAIGSIKDKLIPYCATFLIMQGLMCGVFFATDAILFYIFFEAMLIPMFLIIGLWGGANRVYATIKFFLYTFLGSILLLVALIYLQTVARANGFFANDVFSILTFHNLPLSLSEQKWIFWAFLIAFAVKVPMWPVHTWLPDAHVEAPTGGSVILAAITLKMGGYGFVRFLLPIVPHGCEYFAYIVVLLSLIAIAYIGFVAIAQQDMKKLVAYSSISHMGFVTLGMFIVFEIIKNTNDHSYASMGIEGAMVQMISHGFISGALFLCIGVLYDRMHTRKITDYGGVVNTMPVFATLFMLFAMANCGLPGTSGFVGEFLIILTTFKAKFSYAVIAALTLILGATYTLWMYKRVIFGSAETKAVLELKDLTIYEKIVLSILALAVILFGVYPEPLLNIMHSSAEHLVMQIIKFKSPVLT